MWIYLVSSLFYVVCGGGLLTFLLLRKPDPAKGPDLRGFMIAFCCVLVFLGCVEFCVFRAWITKREAAWVIASGGVLYLAAAIPLGVSSVRGWRARGHRG